MPKDNDHSKSMSTLTFDYVIVGAGPSAMGVLHGLLSPSQDNKSSPSFTIAIIERGHGDPAQKTRSPSNWHAAAHDESSNGVYILRGHVRGRILDIPVGKGVGGGSNINACLCIPPSRKDFETWPEPWRSHLLPSVHKLQDILESNDCVHYSKASGAQLDHVQAGSTDETAEAGRETIFPSCLVQIPCTASKDSSGNIVRRNYYDGLVGPLLQRNPQLAEAVHWFRGYEVQRLLFSGNCAVGIETTSPTSTGFVEIKARKEVILSAGAFESPVLLLAAGIGRKKDLEDAGIPIRKDAGLYGDVGHNLRDHVMLARAVLTPPSFDILSLNGVKALFQVKVEESRFQLVVMDAAVYADLLPHVLAGLFRWHFTTDNIRSRWLIAWANRLSLAVNIVLKSILRVLFSVQPVLWLIRVFVSTIGIFLLNPVSTGSVRVKRRAAFSTASPVRRKDLDIEVNLGYLQDERDVRALMKGWIASDQVIDLLHGVEVFPGAAIRQLGNFRLDWSRFKRFARFICLPYFHWCGTCAMLLVTDQDESSAVVDSELRVRHILSLRVCDASVFPTTTSAPTALTCAALGHLLGSNLAKEHS